MAAHTFNLGPRWPLYSGTHSVGGYFATSRVSKSWSSGP